VHIQDGLKFIRKLQDVYDLIIVDSTDPFGPGEVLFTKEFYGNCYKALREDGVMINQHESPFYSYEADAMKRAHRRIQESFPIHRVYQAHIPSYPSGHWLFGFASITFDPLEHLEADRWNALNIKTRYYNTDLHKGAFYLPNYVKDMLGEK
jgi:spermidine synthase